MLRTLFEIAVSFFAVYGGYCLCINLFYILFCRSKSRICIAYFADEKNNNFSEIFFAKKAFLGRSRVIILVNCNEEENVLREIRKNVAGVCVYRAERVSGFDREYYRE